MTVIAGMISTWLLKKVNYYTGSKDLSPLRYQVRPQTYSVNQLLSLRRGRFHAISTQDNMLGKDTQLHKYWFIYSMQFPRQLTQETAVLAYFLPTSRKGSI